MLVNIVAGDCWCYGVEKSERPGSFGPGAVIYPGGYLLSHAVTSAVPSAQEGLTSVFGMGTGVAPPAMPPGIES